MNWDGSEGVKLIKKCVRYKGFPFEFYNLDPKFFKLKVRMVSSYTQMTVIGSE